MNKFIVTGNLTADPQLKELETTKLTTFAIANNRKYGDKETTSFFDVKVWGNQAESCETYLSKGAKVIVEGRIEQETWNTAGGEKRYKHVIVADNVEFLNTKQEDSKDSDSTNDDDPI